MFNFINDCKLKYELRLTYKNLKFVKIYCFKIACLVIYCYMKIFGFKTNKEDRFVNITCNIIMGIIVLVVFSLSIFSPVVSVALVPVEKVYYNGNKDNKNISLMINVYWGTEYLDDMLATFKANDVKCTFFVGGCWVAKNNDMLQKIYDAGHEIGNHGYNHKDHAKLSAKQNQDEIHTTGELVEAVIGYKMNLFAPPSGSYNNSVLSVAGNLGYKTIMWSKDTIDWRDKSEELVYSRCTKNAENGDLILMHPTLHTSNALGRVIKTLKEKGFNLVTVSENLGV